MEEGEEILLVIKTRRDLFERVKGVVERVHPYDVPECIMVDVEGGNDGYLRWIAESTIGVGGECEG